MARARVAQCHRLPARRELGSEGAAARPSHPTDRLSAAAAGGAGTADRPTSPSPRHDSCDTGHDPLLASRTWRAEVSRARKICWRVRVMTPRDNSTVTISVQGDQLMADVIGFGSGRMIPSPQRCSCSAAPSWNSWRMRTAKSHIIVQAVEPSRVHASTSSAVERHRAVHNQSGHR